MDDRARREEYPPAESQKILRIALAMRGGSSLALWIGGAVAEVDLLRRLPVDSAESPEASDCENDRAVGYRKLLVEAGYGTLEIDIMTGSSAGGLNGILYAVAQRTRQPLRFLDTWVELGGVWQLMRPPGFKKTASLLRGDDYLGVHLFDQIRKMYRDCLGAADPRIPPPPERITVDLSATILDGSDSTDADVREGRAYFHFDQEDIPRPTPAVLNGLSWTNELDAKRARWAEYTAVAEDERLDARRRLPADPRPGAVARLIRLTLAARTTASFTGAFEPAEIISRPYQPDQLADLAALDLSPHFVAHRPLPFHVIDGGIFDNIPIEKALQEARTRVAVRTAERYVLYLDPDPVDVLPHPAPQPRVVRRFVGATIASLHRLKREESEVLEAGEIQTANETRRLVQARLQAFAAVLSTRAAGSGIDASCEAAYLRFRAEADAADATDMLGRPGSWQLSTDPRIGRQAWPNRNPECAAGLPDAFRSRYGQLLSDSGEGPHPEFVSEGAKALLEAAYAVLAWVRFVESIGPKALPEWARYREELGLNRELLYDVIGWASASLDQQYAAVLGELQKLQESGITGPSDTFNTTLVTGWMGSERQVSDAEPKWKTLVLPVGLLVCLSTRIDEQWTAEPPQEWCDTWRQSVWWAALQLWPTTIDPIRRVKDLPLLLASAGASAPVSEIGYHRIGGNEAPGPRTEFASLREASQRAVLQQVLDQSLMSESGQPLWKILLGRTAKPQTSQELAAATERNQAIRGSILDAPIGATEKLAGNTLTKSTSLNVAGFLDAGWRTNDWWWGRLDAAAGMVRFLDSLRPPADRMSKTDLAAEIASRQGEILRDWRRQEPDGSSDDSQAPVDVGNSTLDDLRPSYLVGVASRLLRLATRALSPGLDTLKGFTLGIVFTILRPLLVLLPLAADLSRAALVLMLLTTAGWLATTAGQVPTEMPQSGLMAIGLALTGPPLVIGIAGAVTARRRWNSVLWSLRVSADPDDGVATTRDRAMQEERLLPRAQDLRNRAVVLSLPGLGSMVLASAVVWWWLLSAGQGSPKAAVLIGWTLVAYAGAMIVTRKMLTVPRLPVGSWPTWRRFRPAVFGLATVIVGVIPMAVHLLGFTARLEPDMLPLLLGLVAGLSSWVMVTGWIQPVWQPVIAAVMGAITVGTIWVTQSWIPAQFGAVKPTLMVLIMALVWANALWWIGNLPVQVKTFTATAWLAPPPVIAESTAVTSGSHPGRPRTVEATW